MAFWGIQVKPGKPYEHLYDPSQGRLRISQATMGYGKEVGKCVLQCNVGDKSPILLCCLISNVNESCHLELEFAEECGVTFSVVGPRSVHLSGYFLGLDHKEGVKFGSDEEYGEDIAETESDESGSFDGSDDEYESDFIDDGDLDVSSSPKKSNEVVEEDVKPSDDKMIRRHLKKKNQTNESNGGDGLSQISPDHNASSVMESEEEDGFPISFLGKRKRGAKIVEENSNDGDEMPSEDWKSKIVSDNHIAKASGHVEDSALVVLDTSEASGKKKRKRRTKNDTHDFILQSENRESQDESQKKKPNSLSFAKRNSDKQDKQSPAGIQPEGKVKKKTNGYDIEEKDVEILESRITSFANGLVVEKLASGKADGKKASPGKKVSVQYIGKLENGTIVNSNIGQKPFRFRLGVGKVISGWDYGINGMRVGDKWRLKIPPSMGYGNKKAGSIPANSWLYFDVELVDVK